MIDLVSTLTQPVTVVYIVYLVYMVAYQHEQIQTISLVLIHMIGWMFFYILAIPVFSFMLPLYSLENTMVNSVSLRGVKGIEKVFLLQHDKLVTENDGSWGRSRAQPFYNDLSV
ncbi:Beta and beta-prime subunits of DNA dependent RNA-polymerase [Mycena kentingensis (nom. inval.)]|nr:Beta and beta-prime subunits of DNA dependent RNA-polymerase [Mycena kentingensis (nom. inval.)]